MNSLRFLKSTFFSLLLILLAGLFASCDNSSDLFEDVKNDYSTVYTFYSEDPEATSSFYSTERTFLIGAELSESDFPTNTSSDFYNRKPGYKFQGWSYFKNPITGDQTCPSNIQTEDGLVTKVHVVPSPASFCVREWIPITYSVVFDGNGGVNPSQSSEQTQSGFVYDQDNTLTPNQFSKSGLFFAGWGIRADQNPSWPSYSDGAHVRNLTTVENAVVRLYALWLKEGISILFDAGEGSGTMPSITVGVGSILPSYSDVSETFISSTEGKVFRYWKWTYTSEGVTNTRTFYPGQTLTRDNFPNSDATFVAQYEWKTYYVLFHRNFPNASQDVRQQSFQWGVEQPLMKNGFYQYGYVFLSWNTEPDGSGVSYSDEAMFAEKPEADINLYAQWKECKWTVTFASNAPDRLTMEYTPSGILFRLNVGEKYTSYQWLIDGSAVKSSEDNTFEISFESYPGEHTVAVIGTPADTYRTILTVGATFKINERTY